MKKSDLEEKVIGMDKENIIINVLLNRIEILNRIIEEQEKNSSAAEYLLQLRNNIDKEQNSNEYQILRKSYNNLEKTVSDYQKQLLDMTNKLNLYKDQINKENGKVSELEQYIEKKEQENEELIKRLSVKNEQLQIAEDIVSIYKKYIMLDADIKYNLDGIILEDSIGTFIASIANEDKLIRLYNRIRDVVMLNQQLIVENGHFTDMLYDLATVFEFYYANVCCVDKSIQRERLLVSIGNDYDNDICVRIGDPDGKIADILLQGYRVNYEIKARSIVFVKD